jgi:hypothetical protein
MYVFQVRYCILYSYPFVRNVYILHFITIYFAKTNMIVSSSCKRAINSGIDTVRKPWWDLKIERKEKLSKLVTHRLHQHRKQTSWSSKSYIFLKKGHRSSELGTIETYSSILKHKSFETFFRKVFLLLGCIWCEWFHTVTLETPTSWDWTIYIQFLGQRELK